MAQAFPYKLKFSVTRQRLGKFCVTIRVLGLLYLFSSQSLDVGLYHVMWTGFCEFECRPVIQTTNLKKKKNKGPDYGTLVTIARKCNQTHCSLTKEGFLKMCYIYANVQ